MCLPGSFHRSSFWCGWGHSSASLFSRPTPNENGAVANGEVIQITTSLATDRGAKLALFGIGGNSTICRPENDTWGVGYYHSGITNELPGLFFEDTNGVELFYNIEVTPWFHLTADLQIIDSGFQGVPILGVTNPDTAVVVGLRGKIEF